MTPLTNLRRDTSFGVFPSILRSELSAMFGNNARKLPRRALSFMGLIARDTSNAPKCRHCVVSGSVGYFTPSAAAPYPINQDLTRSIAAQFRRTGGTQARAGRLIARQSVGSAFGISLRTVRNRNRDGVPGSPRQLRDVDASALKFGGSTPVTAFGVFQVERGFANCFVIPSEPTAPTLIIERDDAALA
jgi:hypothetical protein